MSGHWRWRSSSITHESSKKKSNNKPRTRTRWRWNYGWMNETDKKHTEALNNHLARRDSQWWKPPSSSSFRAAVTDYWWISTFHGGTFTNNVGGRLTWTLQREKWSSVEVPAVGPPGRRTPQSWSAGCGFCTGDPSRLFSRALSTPSFD